MTNVSMLSVVVPFLGNKNESLASREKIKQKGFWHLRKKILVNDGLEEKSLGLCRTMNSTLDKAP